MKVMYGLNEIGGGFDFSVLIQEYGSWEVERDQNSPFHPIPLPSRRIRPT
jgi:hypothetical protein